MALIEVDTREFPRCKHRHTILTHPNCFAKELEKCVHRHSILTHPQCFDREGRPKKTDWWIGKKIGFLDIETTNLNAPFGKTLCWYIKSEGKNEYDKFCIDPKDVVNKDITDKHVIQALCDVLNSHKYDIIMTYYGCRFDIPFVRSRALKHGIDFPVQGETYHLDLYFATRSKLKLHSNRLASACEYFGISGKTGLSTSIWADATCGDAGSLKYIYEHNKGDVGILEQLYLKLRPYISFTKRSV